MRKLQAAPKPTNTKEEQNDQQTIRDNARDPNSDQMQEMLGEYLKEHDDVEPITIDPDEVKSILIEPEDLTEENFESFVVC